MSCDALQTRYDALAVAFDKWLMGGGVVTVKQGEKTVQYGPTDGKALQAELTRAKDALAACNGTTTAKRRILRVLPIG